MNGGGALAWNVALGDGNWILYYVVKVNDMHTKQQWHPVRTQNIQETDKSLTYRTTNHEYVVEIKRSGGKRTPHLTFPSISIAASKTTRYAFILTPVTPRFQTREIYNATVFSTSNIVRYS